MRRLLTCVLVAVAGALVPGCGGESTSGPSPVGTWTMRMEPSNEAYANLPPAQRARLETAPGGRNAGTEIGTMELRADGTYRLSATSIQVATTEGTWTAQGAGAGVRIVLRAATPPGGPARTTDWASFAWRGERLVASVNVGPDVGMDWVLVRK